MYLEMSKEKEEPIEGGQQQPAAEKKRKLHKKTMEMLLKQALLHLQPGSQEASVLPLYDRSELLLEFFNYYDILNKYRMCKTFNHGSQMRKK